MSREAEILTIHTDALTVDLIHTIMTMATLLRQRSLSAAVVQTALQDLYAFDDVNWLRERAHEATSGAQNTHQE